MHFTGKPNEFACTLMCYRTNFAFSPIFTTLTGIKNQILRVIDCIHTVYCLICLVFVWTLSMNDICTFILSHKMSVIDQWQSWGGQRWFCVWIDVILVKKKPHQNLSCKVLSVATDARNKTKLMWKTLPPGGITIGLHLLDTLRRHTNKMQHTSPLIYKNQLYHIILCSLKSYHIILYWSYDQYIIKSRYKHLDN